MAITVEVRVYEDVTVGGGLDLSQGIQIVDLDDLSAYETPINNGQMSFGLNTSQVDVLSQQVNEQLYKLWINDKGIIDSIPLTTKGDLLGFSTANVRIPVGADGTFLKADSAAARGVSWASISTGITIGTTPITSGTNNRVLFQSSGVVSQGNLEFSGSELKVLNGSNTNGVSVDGSGYGYFSPSGNRSRFQTYPNPFYVEIYGDGVTGRAYINNTHGSRIVFPVEIGVDAGLVFGTAGQTINFNGGLLTSAYSVSAGYLIANGDISVIGASAYQARFGYDVSNYFNISVGASGGVTFDAIGSGAKFVFSDFVQINEAITSPAVSTSALSTDQHNFSPSTKSRFVRLNATSAIDLTGLTYTTLEDGETHYLANVGTSAITIKHNNGSSTAANRFLLSGGTDIVLNPEEVQCVIYDLTSTRWRALK